MADDCDEVGWTTLHRVNFSVPSKSSIEDMWLRVNPVHYNEISPGGSTSAIRRDVFNQGTKRVRLVASLSVCESKR